ncbi:MAG: hypothetical protein LBN00_06315 [Oscillospiraceae bacterium]|jgi:hypothetical protein|nr:hypothetical protein [Oscillospiraceae bacterium]
MGQILPPDGGRAKLYAAINLAPLKYLAPDGSIWDSIPNESDDNGTQVLPPDVGRAALWGKAPVEPTKYLKSDGSVWTRKTGSSGGGGDATIVNGAGKTVPLQGNVLTFYDAAAGDYSIEIPEANPDTGDFELGLALAGEQYPDFLAIGGQITLPDGEEGAPYTEKFGDTQNQTRIRSNKTPTVWRADLSEHFVAMTDKEGLVIPTPPLNGTVRLEAVDGVLSWVEVS